MLTSKQIDYIVNTVAKEAKEIFGDTLEKVILYGSYARKDSDIESDVDILLLVHVPPQQLRTYRSKMNRVASRLSLDMDVLVSVTVKDSATFNRYKNDLPFYTNVSREGVEFYAQ